MFNKKGKKNIHLDFASTTPVDKKAYKKMKPFLVDYFYNPSSIYSSAKNIKNIIEEYKTKIAKKLQIKSSEIIFTNGGTESINIAILGIAKKNPNSHMISLKTEHPAVLQSLKEAERLGVKVDLLDVNNEGFVSLENLKSALKENTSLVTISYAANETGTIQPISKISREILKYKEKLGRSSDAFPFFHTDASQAGLLLDLNINGLKVDMMTLDGSKIYGPKASGCLIKKNYVELSSILFGGGQEQGLRPGTENVSNIVGFSESLLESFKLKEKDCKKFESLQKYMLEKITKEIPEAKVNGSLKNRMPNNLNFCVKGLNSEFAVIMMDELGVNCSAMTACKSLKGSGQSYAIEAFGEKGCAGSSIRFSFGRTTKRKDIDKAVKALRRVVDFQLSK
jgi:cysteine desulfurase